MAKKKSAAKAPAKRAKKSAKKPAHETTHAAIQAMLHRHAKLHAKHGAHGLASRVPEQQRNILGVGLAKARPDHGVLNSASEAPGVHGVTVYLAEPRTPEEIRQALRDIVPPSVDPETVPIHTVVVGVVRAQSPHTFKMRPAPGGISAGSVRVQGGSVGCVVTGTKPPRDQTLFVLSNNHVLAATNDGQPNDGICQPCVADGGHFPADEIALLEQFVPIAWDAPNTVDAAVAQVPDSRLVRPEIIFIRGGARQLMTISATPVQAVTGQEVAKSGRSTQLTVGQVVDTSATIRVAYGARTAVFVDQIVVSGTPAPFSVDGDSGSLVFTYDETRSPIGLLFAAGGAVSFVNKIDAVLTALDVRIVV